MGFFPKGPEVDALLRACRSNPAPLTVWEGGFLADMEARTEISDAQVTLLQRIAGRHDPKAVSAALAGRMADLAQALTGTEGVKEGSNELRFWPKGGLSVMIAGPERGRWFDHGAGAGGDGIRLIEHLRRCSFGEAVEWAAGWLGLAPGAPMPGPGPDEATKAPDGPRATLLAAQRVWQQAGPAAGTMAEAYLASRGLHLPPEAPIRFHGHCQRGKGQAREFWPAMVVLLTHPETGEPVGVHRTFLSPAGGKAPGKAKMVLGNWGVIRLAPDAAVLDRLGLTEGVETALAVMQLGGWSPVWAAGSAGGIARFPVLCDVDRLTVFADADDDGAGEKAARTVARTWCACGREVKVWTAPAGTDWCDALTARAA